MRSVLVAVALTAASAVSYSQQADFKSLAFGSSMIVAQQAFPEFQCYASSGDCSYFESRSSARVFTYAGTVAKSASLKFVDGRFAGADLTMPASSFVITRAALEAKHGPPTSTVDEEFKTQGGLASSNTIVTWKLAAGGYVRLTRYAGNIAEGSVRIRSSAGDQADAEQIRRHIERAKADV